MHGEESNKESVEYAARIMEQVDALAEATSKVSVATSDMRKELI